MQYHKLDTKYEDELGEEKELLDKGIYFDINDPRNEE